MTCCLQLGLNAKPTLNTKTETSYISFKSPIFANKKGDEMSQQNDIFKICLVNKESLFGLEKRENLVKTDKKKNKTKTSCY